MPVLIGVGPYVTRPPFISQACWRLMLTQAAADEPHGAAAELAAAAIAGVSTVHPAAMASDKTACRKKRIT